MAKGGAYEREVAKQLSLWWSQDWDEPTDELLWRSSMSGGRATVRSKQGKTTSGHYGDIIATDTRATPVVALATWELKCGYSKFSPWDLVDRNRNKDADPMWGHFVAQAIHAHRDAGTHGWCVVARRNGREPFILMSNLIFNELKKQPGSEKAHFTQITKIQSYINSREKKKRPLCGTVIFYSFYFEEFLKCFSPKAWLKALKALDKVNPRK